MKEYLSERPGLIALLLAISFFTWLIVGIIYPVFFILTIAVLILGLVLYVVGVLCMAVGEEIAEKLRR